MADANDRDLAQFERWYTQAGTPRLVVTAEYDAAARRYTLVLRQQAPEGQDAVGFEPLHLPVRIGLIGEDGRDLELTLAGEQPSGLTERVFELTEAEQTLVFEGVAECPVPSINRGFSAPVVVELEQSEAELAFQFANDNDAFNRWEAGQRLFGGWILEAAATLERGGEPEVPSMLVEAFRAVLTDPELDGSMRSLAMALPSELELAQKQSVVRPDELREARLALRRALAEACRSELDALWVANAPSGAYAADQAAIARRRVANAALACASADGDPAWLERAWEHFRSADNMTDSQTALAILCQHDVPRREEALAAFYERWREEPNVLNKWFSLQSTSILPGAAARVSLLLEHPDFSWTNPNRVRAGLSAFAASNLAGFHTADGSGYRLVADAVLRLQAQNPQLASRVVSAFNQWRRFDEGRQDAMRSELERIAAVEDLSKDVFEIVSRALA
ncbi:MAG: DUF3458 domain-containing protein [Planctomycetota bacterium]|jgi:aminopeptidase N